ncbi:MAG: D-alanyl-D-alanine carboxypeptidase family protein [Parvularcula sp.]|nr:D-alanyl-D-alanine carboxypeptidase family protein [Parvularcula sp.]
MIRLGFAVLASAACVLGGGAQAQNEDLIKTKASHAVIMDAASGDILYGKNADEPVPPASMSKLMTVAVVLDLIDQGRLTMETPFYVSEKAWRTGGSKMFVLVDTEIAVGDLLKGIIVQSGNDACIVVAENIAGSEEAFAKLMNARAKAWGLEESTFANPSGLPDPEQRMSMQDLAKLARHIWNAYPAYRDLFSLQEFTWSEITQSNRNPLLQTFPGARGMKTGHTDEAGYGVVGLAEKNGETRIAVVTGLEDEAERRKAATALMDAAFDAFATRTFFEPGDIVGSAEVFAGLDDNVPLRIEQEVTFTLHKKRFEGAEAQLSYEGPLRAPVREGQQVAILTLTIPEEGTRQYPLYTAGNVAGLGAFKKITLGLQGLLTPPNIDEEEEG